MLAIAWVRPVPGMVAGGLLAFIPAACELIISWLVGRIGQPMIGQVIADVVASACGRPMAPAGALLVVSLLVHAHFEGKVQAGGDRGRTAARRSCAPCPVSALPS